MINPLYATDSLDSTTAFVAAGGIGLAFGFFLERAGFSSSRKLAGVFYFTDMTVIKVMFTAVVTAMLGMGLLITLGWITLDRIYLLPTIYGPQIVGGLIFGVGFVMGGWCPGTAAAGLASGKLDALIFLAGAVLGSVVFNEVFSVVKPLYEAGQQGILFVYDSLGMAKTSFMLLLSVAAILFFWICEFLERKVSRTGYWLGSPFLKAFSLAVIVVAVGIAFVGRATPSAGIAATPSPAFDESQYLQTIDQAMDHIEPMELADRLMAGEPGLTLVDVRTPEEFAAFHIRGAVNIPLAELHTQLAPQKNSGIVVLYSNGMTHPAQARDSLYRNGFSNAYILTDGLEGFVRQCLKPVSLRGEPVHPQVAARINAWRSYFLAGAVPAPALSSVEAKPVDQPRGYSIVQASQTFFVLRHLLGYKNVLWYDASWTKWAAHKDLPAESIRK